MKNLRRFAVAMISASMVMTSAASALQAQEDDSEFISGIYEKDGKWYYGSTNDEGDKYVFEKVSHPESGPGETDGLIDSDDRQSQSYSWSAIEYGDYIYIGTCYNSTYGIYYRNVVNMMMGLGKTAQEAQKIARDFVQFVFDDQFPEDLRVHGVLIKMNKKTGEFTEIYEARNDDDPDIAATNCSGYRMAFEKDGKLYFVAMGNPTMFLLEVDPETDECAISFKRALSTQGQQKSIAAGMHGLIVYDGEIIMCFAGEETDQYLDGEMHPEGGMIVASKDGRNWRTIADENDLGPSAYHQYDGLFGGGIWDVIEYNGHLYVTVVRDLTDVSTGIVNKTGFAMYRATKQEDESFVWELMVGEEENGAVLPNGLGDNYSMACNLWVYDGYLYLGTYNDPMLDFTAVADRGDFHDLYHELDSSIYLYRMDADENFELVAGNTTEQFPQRIGNLGSGLGDNGNQYVWRMEEHDGKLWIGTYDCTLLASAFTQLTDGQLKDLDSEAFNKRVQELSRFLNSLGLLQDKYQSFFEKVIGSSSLQRMFNHLQTMVDAVTGNQDPAKGYEAFMEEFEQVKQRFATVADTLQKDWKFKLYFRPAVEGIFTMMDRILEDLAGPVYYFGVNYYIKNAERGFDLLVSEDGVNFTVLSRDGFGDPNNHGLRTITSTDNNTGLFLGTANPYAGAQMWKISQDDQEDDKNNDVWEDVSEEEDPEKENMPQEPAEDKTGNPGEDTASPSAPKTDDNNTEDQERDMQSPAAEMLEMHRLYNPNSGEHFYTANQQERDYLITLGWQGEGIGWIAPKESNHPVYRLYNPNAGDHHYTMNVAEKELLVSLGWQDEGIGWYSDESKSIPLYRAYNPNAKAGAHHYTTNEQEIDYLKLNGWDSEGIAWYGLQ